MQLEVALTTNGVTVCTATAAHLAGATEIDLDEAQGATNGVKLVWDAKADCPADFYSTDAKVKVMVKNGTQPASGESWAFAFGVREAVALAKGETTIADVSYSDTAFGAAAKANVALGWAESKGATGELATGLSGSSAADVNLPKKNGDYVLTHSTGDLTSFVKFTVSGWCTLKIPDSGAHYTYVVSNLTEGAESEITSSGSESGSATYALPIGAKVAIYCIPADGYVVTGTNPYVIDEVTEETTIDAADLPTAEKAPSVSVDYLDWDEVNHKLTNATCTAYTAYTDQTTLDAGKTYVVTGDVTVSTAITVNGTVANPTRLILCDGAKLVATEGVEVKTDGATTNALIICAQSEGASAGALEATGGSDGAAGIGGGFGGAGGAVTINGGTVTATGGTGGAGIGGGIGGSAELVTINGGTVTATGGKQAAGIGGGDAYTYSAGGGCGKVLINGGTVTANGGRYGAGIGGGSDNLEGGTVTINGGTVTAMGADGGSGIGRGDSGQADVTVTFGAGFVGGVLADGLFKDQAAFSDDHSAKSVTTPAVSVKIPAPTGYSYVVSNETEEIAGTLADGTNTYGVVTGATVKVYFTPDEGYMWKVPPKENPMVLAGLWADTVIPLEQLPLAKSVTQEELEQIFDVANTATMVMPVYDADGKLAGHTVILGQDYGPVALSNDFGAVTIDLNGWTIKGTDGADGTLTTAGGNGGAAITVAGGAAMDETSITVKDDACVQLWENGPYFSVRNVGASKPEDDGYYFWWGDTTGYVRNADNNGWDAADGTVTGFDFSSSNAKIETCGKTIAQLYSDGDGYIDADSEEGKLKPEHDAAVWHWGAPWRMPTKAEFDALLTNCTTEWTDDWEGTGKAGRIVKGKCGYEAKSIFLPAAGYGSGTSFNGPGEYGNYWLPTPHASKDECAFCIFVDASTATSGYVSRSDGLSVRAVRGAADTNRPVPGPSAALIGGKGGNGNPAGKGAFAVVDATGAEVSVSDPFALVTKGADGDLLISLPTGVQGYSYVVSNLTAGAEGEIAPSGSQPGGATYALPVGAHVAIYCVPSDGYAVTGTNPYDIPSVATDTTIDTGKLPAAERALTVANVTTVTHWPWDGKIDVSCDLTGEGKVQLEVALTTNGVTVCTAKAENVTGATEIDLDQVGGVTNGVKFTWNAKADCPADFNSTDTKVKVTAKKVKPLGGVQLWEGGPYFAECNVGAEKPEEYGILTNFNDAAQAVTEALGGDWRLPTQAEWDALIENCGKGTWKEQNGFWGRLFTGKGDYASNSIFLPAAGFDLGDGREGAGDEGNYWSSSEGGAGDAWILNFDGVGARVSNDDRSHGLSVRAVRDAKAAK